MRSDRVHILVSIGATLMLTMLSPAALGESVGLAWKPSPSVGATGYNVYYGVSGSFTNKTDAGNNLSTRIDGLQAGLLYFFYATTYDATGDESGPSEIVTYRVNGAPSAVNVTGETLRDQSVALTLIGNDPDGDALTYAIVNPPSHGTLSGIAPNMVYTPAPRYTGPDAFTYRVNDGKVDSALATVAIAVLAPPDTNPPSVAVVSPENGSIVSGTVVINVSAVDDVGLSKIELYLNASLVGTATAAPAGFTWDTSGFTNGTWTIEAKAYDSSGNWRVSMPVSVSLRNLIVDKTPPTVVIVSPKPSTTVTGKTLIEVVASDANGVSKVSCSVNGRFVGENPSANAIFEWDTSAYPDGTYSIQTQAFDLAGNSAAAMATGIVVANNWATPDATPPSVTITSPANGATVSGSTAVAVQATDDRGVIQVDLYADETLLESSISGITTFSLDTTTLTDGQHTLEVRAYDDAQKEGVASVSVNVQNINKAGDTIPPVVAITSPRDGTSVRKNFSVKVSSSDNVGVTQVELWLDGELASTSTSRNPSFTVVASKLTPGLHTFTAAALDAAKNRGVSKPVSVTK